jgi:BMFP domain-containing protein YqiC
MLDPNSIDDIARKLAASIPTGLSGVRQEAETGFRAVLDDVFNKLKLVSREEFDVQSAVLARTRDKLEQLEQTVAELEKQLPMSSPNSKQ